MRQRTVDGDPFVDVFALRERDGDAEVAAAEGGLGLFVEVVQGRALGDVFLGLEGLADLAATAQRASPAGRE
jgi:hypothetical protein